MITTYKNVREPAGYTVARKLFNWLTTFGWIHLPRPQVSGI